MKKSIYLFLAITVLLSACSKNIQEEVYEEEILVEELVEAEVVVSEKDYVLNINSFKVHYPNCSAVKRMLDENKQEVTTILSSILEDGYTRCGICYPR